MSGIEILCRHSQGRRLLSLSYLLIYVICCGAELEIVNVSRGGMNVDLVLAFVLEVGHVLRLTALSRVCSRLPARYLLMR